MFSGSVLCIRFNYELYCVVCTHKIGYSKDGMKNWFNYLLEINNLIRMV